MSSTVAPTRLSRLGGLRRFAVAITILNVVGRSFLGFEPSWFQWFVALATAYIMELLIETAIARSQGRAPAYQGGFQNMIDFLLSAHIAGTAVSMLLYASADVMPFVFATAVAIGSKALLRIPTGTGSRHFMNPSNFGITMTLLAFPWVSIAAPYQFTENLFGWADWLLPAIIVCTGTFLNGRFTQRLPLIGAWLGGFVGQALFRTIFFDVPLLPGLVPMTGVAFLLFTFYMVTDPATTPSSVSGQVTFGLGVAALYGLMLHAHIVFGVFYALTIVCFVHGIILYLYHLAARRMQPVDAAPAKGAAQSAGLLAPKSSPAALIVTRRYE